MDLFEKAAREKLRFDTNKGALTAEDLFDLPLTSARGHANLDAIAIGLDQQIKAANVTSFVENTTAGDATAKLKFDICLRVIEIKQAERKANAERQANAEKKQKLLEILSRKQDADLEGKSVEELTAMVNSLA
jgi:hypothetical protein